MDPLTEEERAAFSDLIESLLSNFLALDENY